MPIPDLHSLMLPIMKIATDGAEHTARELRQRIEERLGLTEEERKELLPRRALLFHRSPDKTEISMPIPEELAHQNIDAPSQSNPLLRETSGE